MLVLNVILVFLSFLYLILILILILIIINGKLWYIFCLPLNPNFSLLIPLLIITPTNSLFITHVYIQIWISNTTLEKWERKGMQFTRPCSLFCGLCNYFSTFQRKQQYSQFLLTIFALKIAIKTFYFSILIGARVTSFEMRSSQLNSFYSSSSQTTFSLSTWSTFSFIFSIVK
jgi:hypothetical protein